MHTWAALRSISFLFLLFFEPPERIAQHAAAHAPPADFLDVHVYPEATGVQASFLAVDLGSVEWPIIQSNLPKMAVLMGEFGTYEGTFPDVVLAGACFHVVVLVP